MKYAVPTDDGKTVGTVFGRAKNFAIYDQTDSSITVLPNEGSYSEHGAGTGAVSFLAGKGVGTVVSPEIGPKAMDALGRAGIGVKTVESGISLNEALAETIASQ